MRSEILAIGYALVVLPIGFLPECNGGFVDSTFQFLCETGLAPKYTCSLNKALLEECYRTALYLHYLQSPGLFMSVFLVWRKCALFIEMLVFTFVVTLISIHIWQCVLAIMMIATAINLFLK
jgi:high-affinity Fe2+/Pb2+ permease